MSRISAFPPSNEECTRAQVQISTFLTAKVRSRHQSPSLYTASFCHFLLIPHRSLNVSLAVPFLPRRRHRWISLSFFCDLSSLGYGSFLALPPSDIPSNPPCSTRGYISVLCEGCASVQPFWKIYIALIKFA